MKNLFLFSSLFFIACASNPKRDYTFIENPETINVNPDKNLSGAEVKHDIAQAIYALNTAYSGKKFLPHGQFDNLVKGISQINAPMKAAELCEKIDYHMHNVSDNHLSAKFNKNHCFKNSNRRAGSVGKNFYKEKNDIPWTVQLSKKNKKTALLISITSFPSSTNPVWSGFIDLVKKELPKSNLVILDMRGNGGGDDSKGFALASLLAGAELKEPYAKQWNNPAPEAQQVFINSFDYWINLAKADGKEAPPYLVELKRKYVEKRDLSLKPISATEIVTNDANGSDFSLERSIKKPIYILIDADCASSCESTTDFFEYNTLVKTVGENTAGYVHFGNNGIVFLKNSGIGLQMATSYNSYTDGRFIEKKGITPKIKVPAGKDAMDFAWYDFLKEN